MDETENAVVIWISNSRFAIRKRGRDEADSDRVADFATKRRCSSTFTVLPSCSLDGLFCYALTGANCGECPDDNLRRMPGG